MAVTRGPRTNVYRWSDGADPFVREQMDVSHASIEDLMAIDLQGTMAARPLPSVRGRFYTVVEADTADPNHLITFRDTGAAWVVLSRKAVTHRQPHTFQVSGDVLVASGDNFVIPPMFVPAPAGQTARLVGVRTYLKSGTSATWRLRRLSGTVWTTVITDTTTTPTNGGFVAAPAGTTFADLDMLALEVMAVSGTPRVLAVTALIDYTA